MSFPNSAPETPDGEYFLRRDTPTIMSGRVVRWREKSDYGNVMEISASRDGVMLQGYSGRLINSAEILAEYQRILQKAFTTYLDIKTGAVQ